MCIASQVLLDIEPTPPPNESYQDYVIRLCAAENGALTERVEWEPGKLAKNWVASVTPGGPSCQFKLARDFVNLCKNSNYYVLQSDLKIGECYEFASNSNKSKNTISRVGRSKMRTYAIPLSHTSAGTYLAVFSTVEEMFSCRLMLGKCLSPLVLSDIEIEVGELKEKLTALQNPSASSNNQSSALRRHLLSSLRRKKVHLFLLAALMTRPDTI